MGQFLPSAGRGGEGCEKICKIFLQTSISGDFFQVSCPPSDAPAARGAHGAEKSLCWLWSLTFHPFFWHLAFLLASSMCLFLVLAKTTRMIDVPTLDPSDPPACDQFRSWCSLGGILNEGETKSWIWRFSLVAASGSSVILIGKNLPSPSTYSLLEPLNSHLQWFSNKRMAVKWSPRELSCFTGSCLNLFPCQLFNTV